MRYVASYLLAALGGNPSPSAKDIKKILDSVGIEADDDRLNKLCDCLLQVISELNGKNIEDVIAQGIGKLASVPAGGAVTISAAPGSAAPAAGSAPAAAEEKKDEKKEESEESDDDMGFGLFD
ncbi:60S acidic ribosomal protein P2 isoform X1 [Cebus imitator]|uniref:Large ribosomal subunit protein P2 n=1 Tax=Sapajus apella TaxID=9515 RepID=A0A6J3H9H1_SAPAP|nr:60S acidic ribosomal protein P2 isoform X1 [Cebus imitator]XP_032126419.1 60S acidic ribosomal protein P2 isoform X1 [Sapajus apella]